MRLAWRCGAGRRLEPWTWSGAATECSEEAAVASGVGTGRSRRSELGGSVAEPLPPVGGSWERRRVGGGRGDAQWGGEDGGDEPSAALTGAGRPK